MYCPRIRDLNQSIVEILLKPFFLNTNERKISVDLDTKLKEKLHNIKCILFYFESNNNDTSTGDPVLRV